MLSQLPPLSLYIHIPWCERKCPYCDFNSHENKSDFNEAEYIQCLVDDFKNELIKAQGRELQSIFIGGGTPSLFEVANIDFLLSQIKQEINFSKNIEITLEANPASSQGDYFYALSQTQVNRVSLGVQSFKNEKLSALGRLHSSEEAAFSLDALKKNFKNFNIDLMFSLPKQTIDDCLFDLKTALKFSPSHLSWYQLTIEPNTVFYRNTPVLPNEDFIFDMHLAGKDFLEINNYQQYEISAFSQANKQSIHNLNYWLFGDYLAIGAGAHGKISYIDKESIEVTRFQKSRMPKEYMHGKSKQFTAKNTIVAKNELALEFFMNTFRLNKAISVKLFEERTGLTFIDIKNFCEKAKALNLITVEQDWITKTPLGEKHVDSLLALF